VEGTADPDVTISYGDVPESLSDAAQIGLRFQASPGELLLVVDGVARYLVRNGRGIIIDRMDGVSDSDIRIFLLGSAFGALMHQRGLLALHASAIGVNDGCVAFLGYSGMGKSTLATAFGRKGYSILTDDVCAVGFDAEQVPTAVPGYPQTKLWLDSLKKFEMDPEPLRKISPSLEKRALPMSEAFSGKPLPLRRIYVLTHAEDELSIEPIWGPEKFIELRKHTYRPSFLEGLGVRVPHFQQLSVLAAQLPLVRVMRPYRSFMLDELVSMLEEDFLE